MAMTLLEQAKIETGDVYKQGVIEFYAGSSGILEVLPFMPISGNALKYNTEDTLPGVAFRGINSTYTESTGVINPQTESLTISGGTLDVDKFLVDTQGSEARTMHEAMKIRALALNWTNKFIKGDSNTTIEEFDGLQIRLVGDQLIAAGATSGGDALSLAKLDELIDQTINPTHLVMNKTMKRLLTTAARNTSIGGFISFTNDEFGRTNMFYNGLPIITLDLDNTGTAILPFTEANPGGGAAASTSIYCVNFSEEGVMGIQNGDMRVEDLGLTDSGVIYRTIVEWYTSFAVFHGRGAARLNGIKNAAVVV
jgi:hypothetical protein